MVSEWRSVIAVSLNVGGGVHLIKPAKLYMCMQNTTNTTRTDARCRVCAAMVLYRQATRGMSLRELEYTHAHSVSFCLLNSECHHIQLAKRIIFYGNSGSLIGWITLHTFTSTSNIAMYWQPNTPPLTPRGVLSLMTKQLI